MKTVEFTQDFEPRLTLKERIFEIIHCYEIDVDELEEAKYGDKFLRDDEAWFLTNLIMKAIKEENVGCKSKKKGKKKK